MGVRSPPEEAPWTPRPIGPSPLAAALLGLVLFLLLVSNGRPIGSGDARPTERVAASLVREADFDLDEFPEVDEPFARTVGSHRVSIYPVASAVLATPVFAAAGALFAYDETGLALAGKWASSLFSAAAGTVLFLAVARRRPREALWTAVAFTLGTTVWATSQALWQHPAAVFGLSGALLCAVRAEEDEAWAGRAGLPLALALAARYADVALVAVLAAGLAARWPRRLPSMLAWGAPVGLAVLAYHWAYFGSPWRQGLAGAGRFDAPWGEGHLGLLVSPGKGLLVFTPLVAMAGAGLVRAFRGGDRWLASTCAAGALAHWVLVGRWGLWHGGECWGPRLMTDALPLLFLFLPEGFSLAPRLTVGLGVFSVAVQALGAFSYDYRWERLRQRPVTSDHPELWDVPRSPIAFYAARRVATFALPDVVAGRAVVHEHPVVLAGPRGSRVTFTGGRLRVEGAEETMEDVHETRGAAVHDGHLRLRGRWDGLFLRVTPGARARVLELRVTGQGRGTLYVGERSFRSATTRWTAYPMAGRLRIVHPYAFATSGGPDLEVTLGRAAGSAELESVALVPRGEPDRILRLP
ncbi:MAG TPA: hypothetical protein VMR21_12855 [Vicinamibacteria bacterium]|nr:hypothetical protein [Vicinamibacteria bacterium]